MGKFDDFILVSDFDGTLIADGCSISRENIEAINYFVIQGGRFLGATGRSEFNVRPYTQDIELLSPWILYNGAAIFDWVKNSFIYKAPLNQDLAEQFARKVMAKFSSINIQVFSGGPFCHVNRNALPDSHAVRENQHFEQKEMENIKDAWLKILFCSENLAEIQAIEAMLDDDPLRDQVHKTHSSTRYFELTAPGVSKGSALAMLKKIIDPSPRCVVAIGDYTNDIEMLLEADISAAPDNALPCVKSIAKIITVDCTKSAVADLVGQLEMLVPL